MFEVSLEKVNARIFYGLQIKQLINDHHLVDFMNETERKAWDLFILVVKNFPDNHKAENYVDLLNIMLNNFRYLGCNMSIKVHYLFTQLFRLFP